MEKLLSDKIEKALRKLMDEDHYKISAFQLQEWLIDTKKLEIDGSNYQQQIINTQLKEIITIKEELDDANRRIKELDILGTFAINEQRKLLNTKFYGCFAGGKLLRIYLGKENAEKDVNKWSADLQITVKPIKEGDGCA